VVARWGVIMGCIIVLGLLLAQVWPAMGDHKHHSTESQQHGGGKLQEKHGPALKMKLVLWDVPEVDPSIELKGGEKLGHVTEPWHSIRDEFGEYPARVDVVLVELRKEVGDEIMRELRSVEPDFKTRWRNAYKSVTEKLTNTKLAALRTEAMKKLHEYEAKLLEKEEGLKDKLKDWTHELTDKVREIEEEAEEELGHLKSRIDRLFHRVEHHMHHKPHHPIIRCGACGKQFTLQEFLAMAPDLVVDEQDWWTDEDIENFYSGWPEWANRYAIKCPQCGETKWGPVEFVIEEEEEGEEPAHKAHLKEDL